MLLDSKDIARLALAVTRAGKKFHARQWEGPGELAERLIKLNYASYAHRYPQAKGRLDESGAIASALAKIRSLDAPGGEKEVATGFDFIRYAECLQYNSLDHLGNDDEAYLYYERLFSRIIRHIGWLMPELEKCDWGRLPRLGSDEN
tara:strand:- start:665 stop:1105 length:441 start_codon:yes stop_codon:yes gene_type:complete